MMAESTSPLVDEAHCGNQVPTLDGLEKVSGGSVVKGFEYRFLQIVSRQDDHACRWKLRPDGGQSIVSAATGHSRVHQRYVRPVFPECMHRLGRGLGLRHHLEVRLRA